MRPYCLYCLSGAGTEFVLAIKSPQAPAPPVLEVEL
jgi:hypothetical protein